MSASARKIVRLLDDHTPRVLPSGWSLYEDYENAKVYAADDGMRVIVEVAEYQQRLWLHVSCSYRNRYPNWEQLKDVKELFCGREALALQVLPPASEYVNINPNVLHLWCALEGARPVPDFTRGRKAI